MRTNRLAQLSLLLTLALSIAVGCDNRDGGPSDGGPDGFVPLPDDGGADSSVPPLDGGDTDGGTDGSAPECVEAQDCEGEDTTCRSRTCEDGVCGTVDAPAATPCTEGGTVCDGEGACVGCLEDAHCEGEQLCDGHVCVAPSCANGALDEGETDVDCGGPDCAPCEVGDACALPGDCASGFCDDSVDPNVCAACTSDEQCEGDDYCDSAGACQPSPCTPESCAIAPMAVCVDGNAITYAADGTCTSPGGVVTCDHEEASNTDCADSDQACVDGACVDPCVGFTCAEPPAADCVDNSRRTYGAGVCESPGGVPGCVYPPTLEDCGALSCVAGACVDPCDGVSCSDVPADDCDGNSRRTYAGVCADGACSYPATVVEDCGTLSCVDGACVDPCDGVSCSDVPADDCDGSSRRTYAGVCTDGTCSYPATVVEDCAATPGGTCVAGACVDPCAGVSCDEPPADDCDGNSRRTYAGACTDGTCSYTPTVVEDCGALSCVAGACVDPCASVTCDDPPADDCDGSSRRTYAGSCTDGTCSYTPTVVEDCAATPGGSCVAGACVGACEGVTCASPDTTPVCDGNNVVAETGPGTCAVSGAGTAECSYPTTVVTDCAAIDQQCASGACVDPCAPNPCVAPPAICDGSEAVTYDAACVSPGGVQDCNFSELSRVDCAASMKVCQAGGCVDLCTDVTCDMPPAPTCVDSTTERVATLGGSCTFTTGECDYGVMDQACATGETCVDGVGCVLPPLTIGWCNTQFPTTVTGATGSTADIFGQLYIAGHTDQGAGNHPDARIVVELGYGDTAEMPSSWTTWTAAAPNSGWSGVNNDEYMVTWTLPSAGAYDYAFRVSGDGGETFVYCDTNGDAYDPSDAGKATVTSPSAVTLYTQSFDSLPSSGSPNRAAFETALPDWAFLNTNNSYQVGTGSGTTGGIYSFGATDSTERALGGVGSGSTDTQHWGFCYTNDQPTALSQLTLTYVGEQWRAVNTVAHQLDVSYSLDPAVAASLATTVDDDTGWTRVGELDFVSPNLTTSNAIDGNAPGNRTERSHTFAETLAVGATFCVRWRDIDNSSSDHGLAIDDLVLTAVPQ